MCSFLQLFIIVGRLFRFALFFFNDYQNNLITIHTYMPYTWFSTVWFYFISIAFHVIFDVSSDFSLLLLLLFFVRPLVLCTRFDNTFFPNIWLLVFDKEYKWSMFVMFYSLKLYMALHTSNENLLSFLIHTPKQWKCRMKKTEKKIILWKLRWKN